MNSLKKLVFPAIVLLCCSVFAEESTQLLKHVPVPSVFKELPFVETNPEPALSETEKARGYMLFSRPITDTVYPNTYPLQSERTDCLYGFGAQGEFEPLNLCVYPIRDIENMKVSISDLKCDGKSSKISRENIDIRLLTYWNIRYPFFNSERRTYRRMPELLEKAGRFSFPAKECMRYWFTIKIPDDCPAGIYKGQITFHDDGFAGDVTMPVSFRAFGFKLEKDPDKHFSSIGNFLSTISKYDNAESKEKKEFWKNVMFKEYMTMRDYGFDASPQLALKYDEKNDCLFLPGGGYQCDIIMKAGIKRPVPVFIDLATRDLYIKYTGVTKFRKWHIPVNPDEKFYLHLSRLVKAFEEKRKAEKWPDFIYCPADEIDNQVADFGSRCFKALKDAGVKTFITKDPELSVYENEMYNKYIDVWCTQTFSVPYDKIMNSGKEYWCYPNLIAGEIRKPEVMCRGGRMTYGFGFWKSGYSTITPWGWRWDQKPFFIMDYLSPERSTFNGNKIDEKGEFIPAVNWECYREGYDDGRYIYTLQLAIEQRENSGIEKCQQVVAESKKFLKKIWDMLPRYENYDDKNSLESLDFIALRWRMAELTEQLLKYPATNKMEKASSVLPFCYDRDNKKDFSRSVTDFSGYYNMFKTVDNESWKAGDKESFVEYITEPSSENKKLMLFKVMVDYKKDGESETGKHPVGWPRCNLKFNEPKDFSKYEGLFFRIKFSSNRNESAKNYTHLTLECKNSKNERVFSYDLLGARMENEWIPIMIPFNEENDCRSDFTLLKTVSSFNLVAPERFYPDKTEISFLIDGPYLCSAKETFIANAGHPRFILKTNNSFLPVSIYVNGVISSSPFKLKLLVEDNSGKKIYSDNISIMNSEFKYYLPLDKFKQGKYVLKLLKDDSLLYFSKFEIYSAE